MNAKTLMIACISAAALVGCEEKPAAPVPSKPPPKPPAATQPDNTAKNVVDRDTSATAPKTPMDQSNTQSDIDITAKIRSSIMADKAMSTNAQNCKIITEKGAVTLRGVVDSAAEKTAVESLAKATPNVVTVDNQLEVKAAP